MQECQASRMREEEGHTPPCKADLLWASNTSCGHLCGNCRLSRHGGASSGQPPAGELAMACDASLPPGDDGPLPNAPTSMSLAPEDSEELPSRTSPSPAPSSSRTPSPFASPRSTPPPPAAQRRKERAPTPAEVLPRLPAELRGQLLARLAEEDRAGLAAELAAEAELAVAEVQVVSVDGLQVGVHPRLALGPRGP